MAKKKTRSSRTLPSDEGPRNLQFTLSELETAAFRELNAISEVIWSARALKAKESRPLTFGLRNLETGHQEFWSVRPTPTQRLLADYLAMYEFDGFPDFGGPALDWLNRAIMADRQNVLSLSSGPRASAFGVVWMLPEAALPVPHDPFCFDQVFRELWRTFASDPELGEPEVARRVTIKKAAPALRSDFRDLSTTLVCGFTGTEDPPSNWFSPVQRKLAAAIAHNKPLRQAIRRVRVSDLADFLDDLASDQDLYLIGQELRLEFARVEDRVNDLIPPTATAKRTRLGATSNQAQGALPPPDPRGQFAYSLLRGTISLKEARKRFNDRAAERGWEEVSTDNGIKWLATRYAEVRGLPPIPPRKSY